MRLVRYTRMSQALALLLSFISVAAQTSSAATLEQRLRPAITAARAEVASAVRARTELFIDAESFHAASTMKVLVIYQDLSRTTP